MVLKKVRLGATETVSAKGWVVIPKELRDKLGLKKGSKVVFVEYGNVISIAPASEDPIGEARGMFGSDGPSWTEIHMREKREEEAERDAKYERNFGAIKTS
jgi:AbrB family looped-hinge helix DNA binding protein